MSNTINLELVRQGDAHLKRAKQLNPNVTARPVPVADVGAFDVPTLANLAGVHPQTIRRAIEKGELKAARNGRYSQARISRTDAEVWWRGRGGGTLLGDLAPAPVAAPAIAETPEQRRARINAAIDEAQQDFAHINRVFGDPVKALEDEKRADVARAAERGL